MMISWMGRTWVGNSRSRPSGRVLPQDYGPDTFSSPGAFPTPDSVDRAHAKRRPVLRHDLRGGWIRHRHAVDENRRGAALEHLDRPVDSSHLLGRRVRQIEEERIAPHDRDPAPDQFLGEGLGPPRLLGRAVPRREHQDRVARNATGHLDGHEAVHAYGHSGQSVTLRPQLVSAVDPTGQHQDHYGSHEHCLPSRASNSRAILEPSTHLIRRSVTCGLAVAYAAWK